MRIPLNHQARRTPGCDAGGWHGLPPLAVRRGRIGRLLNTRGSLTAALRGQGETTVTLLHQHLAHAHRDERGLLDARERGRLQGRLHSRLMVREVLLHVDGAPWVFAHTLANEPARRLLRRAGRRPLATVLFIDPKVSAGNLRYRSLEAGHPLWRKAAAVLPALTLSTTIRLPARRALFVRGAARLVVTEVFLPAAC